MLEYLRSLIGAAGDHAALYREHANETPQRVKYELTASERAWTRSRTRLDEELYASLCGGRGACALRAMRAGAAEESLLCAERPKE